MLIGGGVLGLTISASWVGAVGACLLLGLGFGAGLAAARRYTLTRKGARALARMKGYLEYLRSRIEKMIPRDPVSAARLFDENLPWLSLDTEIDRDLMDELTEALDQTEESFDLPVWIDNVVEEPDQSSPAAVMFASYIAVVNGASARTSPGGGGAGAASAGAGAGGGAGGGGGGAA